MPRTRDEVSALIAARFAQESQNTALTPNEAAAVAITAVQQRIAREDALIAEIAAAGLDDAELVSALLDSTGGDKLTTELAAQFIELLNGCALIVIGSAITKARAELQLGDAAVGDVLLLPHVDSAGRDAPIMRRLEAPDGTVVNVSAAAKLSTFGVWRIAADSSSRSGAGSGSSSSAGTVSTPTPLFVSSATFECAWAIERLYDRYFWSWKAEWWDDAIESCLCSLLIAITEDLQTFTASFAPIMSMLHAGEEGGEEGGGAAATFDALHEQAVHDVERALKAQDGAAIGRLHQTLFQFLDFGEFRMMLPRAFTAALEAFDQLRFSRVIAEGALDEELRDLARAIPPYTQAMRSANNSGGGVSPGVARLWALGARLQAHFDRAAAGGGGADGGEANGMSSAPPLEASMLHGLMGGPLEPKLPLLSGTSITSSGSVSSGGVPEPSALQCLPVLPLQTVAEGNGALLDEHAARLSEVLVRDACSLGSPLIGYSLAPAGHAAWTVRDAGVFFALMRAGFGYVTQGNRVMPVLPMRRAVLRLAAGAPRPHKLKSRQKDVSRTLRNTPPPHPFQLRVSTDLPQACRKLEQHHENSWVGPALRRVWEEMLAAGSECRSPCTAIAFHVLKSPFTC